MEDRQDHQRGFTFDSKLVAGKFNFSNHTLKIMWIKLQTNFRRFECEFFSISNAIDFTWSVVVIETGRYFDRSITAVSRRRSRSHNTGNDHIISCSLPTEHRCVCVINDPIFAKNKQSTLSLFFSGELVGVIVAASLVTACLIGVAIWLQWRSRRKRKGGATVTSQQHQVAIISLEAVKSTGTKENTHTWLLLALKMNSTSKGE